MAGGALWLAARYVVFLYQPVRFVVVTIPLVASLTAGVSFAAAAERIRAPRARAAAVGALVVAIVGGFAPRLDRSPRHRVAARALRDAAPTPADALIAGPPLTLDFVPPFAERRVLVSDEMMPPLFVRRYETVRALMAEMLAAYTAAEPAVVDRFCDARGVTHWIVELHDFDPRATWSLLPALRHDRGRGAQARPAVRPRRGGARASGARLTAPSPSCPARSTGDRPRRRPLNRRADPRGGPPRAARTP